MTAAAEILSDRSHIHDLIGSHADLELILFPLAEQNRHLNTLGGPQLVDDPVQIRRLGLIKSHILHCHNGNDHQSVHQQAAFRETLSHDLELLVGFIVKTVIYNLSESDALAHQFSGNSHRLIGGVVMLEHPGIMDDPYIEAFRDLLCDLLRVKKVKDQFRGRARLRENIVFIRKAVVADMMVDAERRFRTFKVSGV